MSIGTNARAAPLCAQPAEQPALNARVVQTQLMVAALTCEQRDRYNAFVQKFSPQLAESGQTMKAVFKRQYGRSAENQMNQFVTRLANDASARSRTTPGFCGDTLVLFDALDKIEPVRLTEVATAQSFAATHGIGVCGTAKNTGKKATAKTGNGK
ncbi:MAG: hypothetical protein H7840_16500 [Alphaproteobacteria bacterium]